MSIVDSDRSSLWTECVLQADAKVVAEIQARYAGHLYNKHDHDGAMQQYLATIGHLEPSFVIRKFLDAQRILNLTAYLEALHSKALTSALFPLPPFGTAISLHPSFSSP